jgi:hypothetical protein
MKFTSEDLMKAMGLSVGDRVKIHDDIYEVKQSVLDTIYLRNDFLDDELKIVDLIDLDYEILPRPKRVGDLECNHDCSNCPLRIIPSCRGCGSKTLYKILETYKTLSKDDDKFDQEIYDLLKARLDKVVSE